MAKNSIDVLVRANSSKFNSEMKRGERSLDSFSKKVKSTNTKGASGFKGLIKLAAKLGIALSAVAIAAKTLKSALGLVTGAFGELDSIGKASDRLDIATESLGALRHAATKTGSTTAVLDKTLERLSKRSYLASEGTGAAKRALEDLGINAKELSNLSVDKQFEQIADAISKVENPSRRMALTSEILGDESRSLINLMSEGAEGIKTYREEAERLGILASKSDTKKIAAAVDAWNDFKKSLKGVGQHIAIFLSESGALVWMSEAMTTAVVWLRKAFEQFKPVLVAWGKAYMAYFKAVYNLQKAIITKILEVLKPLTDWFASLFPDTVDGWVNTLVAAFATVEFAFNNLGKLWTLVADKMKLGTVTMWEDFKQIFTSALPTILAEFGAGTLQFFSTLASNIASAIGEIWDYVSSGGTDAIEIQWKPLADGYKKALENTKKALEREETPLEAMLRKEIEAQEKSLMGDLTDHISKRLEEAGRQLKESTDKDKEDKEDKEDEDKRTAAQRALTPNAVEFGTQEAFTLALDAMEGWKTQKQLGGVFGDDPRNDIPPELKEQLAEQKKMNKNLERIDEALRENNLELANIA